MVLLILDRFSPELALFFLIAGGAPSRRTQLLCKNGRNRYVCRESDAKTPSEQFAFSNFIVSASDTHTNSISPYREQAMSDIILPFAPTDKPRCFETIVRMPTNPIK